MTQIDFIVKLDCEVMGKLNREIMKKFKLEVMPTDELWALHEEVSQTLSARLSEEKRVLDERMNRLSNHAHGQHKPLKPRSSGAA
jgi:hypothetical protein